VFYSFIFRVQKNLKIVGKKIQKFASCGALCEKNTIQNLWTSKIKKCRGTHINQNVNIMNQQSKKCKHSRYMQEIPVLKTLIAIRQRFEPKLLGHVVFFSFSRALTPKMTSVRIPESILKFTLQKYLEQILRQKRRLKTVSDMFGLHMDPSIVVSTSKN
jgi:hypothetical protein